jgi:hypothetical protein
MTSCNKPANRHRTMSVRKTTATLARRRPPQGPITLRQTIPLPRRTQHRIPRAPPQPTQLPIRPQHRLKLRRLEDLPAKPRPMRRLPVPGHPPTRSLVLQRQTNPPRRPINLPQLPRLRALSPMLRGRRASPIRQLPAIVHSVHRKGTDLVQDRAITVHRVEPVQPKRPANRMEESPGIRRL